MTMSYDPNQHDPYSQQPGGQYDPHGQSPYGHPPQYAPPPKKSRTGMWLLLIFGGGGVMVLLCCGGCIFLAMIGSEEESDQLRARYADHPAVVEQIGEIDSLSRNWTDSLEDDDNNIWIFDISGDRGSGQLIIRESSSFSMEEELDLDWAKLVTDAGEFELE